MVYLVGAGPGDPGLITVRGAELVGRAEVLVYDGLVSAALVDLAPPGCERIYAGKKHAPDGSPLSQDEINQLLVDRAAAGRMVVRLKGGDSFVFGRGAEECMTLHDAGIGFEVVPGVTAATAVPAYAGIPLTARGLASTVAFATGHEADGKAASAIDWEALARAGTLVLFMSLKTMGQSCQSLIAAGRSAHTPAAAIYWGTTSAQRTVVATLGELPEAVERAGLKPPVLVVVGEVVGLRDALAWYERRPLFGARVLVPRSAEQAPRFAHLLAELGAEPVIMPVTRMAPPADDAAIERAVAALPGYAWLVFTSANAVARFFEELEARSLDARALAACRVASVGPATTAALAARGIRADVVPERGHGARLAAAMLARSDDARGMRVLLPRAERGRDEAALALGQAGAVVDVVPVYRTVPAPADDPAICRAVARLRAGAIDVLAAFAPSQVTALCELLGADATALLGACRVIAAIGDTTAAALTDRGLDVHVVASSPDAEILAREIAACYVARRARLDPSQPTAPR